MQNVTTLPTAETFERLTLAWSADRFNAFLRKQIALALHQRANVIAGK